MSDAPVLNPLLDADVLAACYAANKRLHIPNFLIPASAKVLYEHLRSRSDWRLIINQDDAIFELDRAAQAGLTAESRIDLENAVYARARAGFQYRYELIRVPEDDNLRDADTSPLTKFAKFMSSPAVLAFLSKVIGGTRIDFSDAQATAYGPGHFLTTHDDKIAGKNRQAAYVFNLSQPWRPEWGGLLMFNGSDGHIEEAFSPSFNALNLFTVPQPHSVSYVTPFVPYRRYAITGWLRQR